MRPTETLVFLPSRSGCTQGQLFLWVLRDLETRKGALKSACTRTGYAGARMTACRLNSDMKRDPGTYDWDFWIADFSKAGLRTGVEELSWN